MSLDFTALNNISQQAIKTGLTELKSHEARTAAPETKKPATGQQGASEGQATHTHILDGMKTERARMREAYSTYQEHIKRAGSCRSDILKGMKRGEDPIPLLLKAIECISLMTGDGAILEQGKRDIATIYGWRGDTQLKPAATSKIHA